MDRPKDTPHRPGMEILPPTMPEVWKSLPASLPERMYRMAAVALLLSLCGGLEAATLSLTLRRAVEAKSATLLLRRIDEVEDLRRSTAQPRIVDLKEPLPQIDLDAGHWSIAVQGESIWHAPQYFTVAGDTTVALDIWPAANVEGRIATTAKSPAEITIRFESATTTAIQGEVKCPLANGAFRCALPAAALDLRLRARGFIAHYLHDLQLAPGETRDLGPFAFREGQSITGRVELPRELRNEAGKVIIRAEPAATMDGERPLVRGGSLLPVTAIIGKNGFFHIDGVAPGAWIVRARHPKQLHAAPVSVTVLGGADAHLIAPLRLDRPRAIEVLVEPARDPGGGRWQIELTREVTPGRLEPVFESAAGEDGSWKRTLLPGTYIVSVKTASGDEWFRERVDHTGGDTLLRVSMQSVAAKGVVTLGGTPLRATLEFSNERGATSTATSDEEGRFSVTLPDRRATEWEIGIDSEQPLVQRTLTGVKIDSEELKIDLPNIVLRGEVVDEKGEPVPYPLIRVLPAEGRGLTQPTGSEAGTFSIAGLAPGPKTLQATGTNHRESDPMPIVIPEEGEPEVVRLVLREQKPVRGYVESEFGPVAGATVVVFGTDVPGQMAYTERTDANGRFTARLPPDAREFDIIINPPGFSYTIDHAAYQPSVLRARVDQVGGTITIHGAETQGLRLVHEGAIVAVAAAVRDTGGYATDTEAVLRRMEPGPYAVCSVEPAQWPLFRTARGASGGRCVNGILPPNGTLTLDLEDKRVAAR